MIDVQLARTRQQLDRCLAMRRTVFTEELGVPPEVDVDGHDVLDGECLHFLVTDGGRDIGAIRCTPQEDGTVRLQRFCIHKDSRSHGAGRLTLRFLEGFFAGGDTTPSASTPSARRRGSTSNAATPPSPAFLKRPVCPMWRCAGSCEPAIL